MNNGVCSIDGCVRPTRARGWCGMHFQRWQKHGDPLKVGQRYQRPANTVERFWVHVDRSGGPNACWPWVGKLNADGYGDMRLAGVRRSHRIAHFLATGERPNGLVCHHCDNPPCCNPDHLYLGTHRDNVQDCLRRGRWVLNKLTEDQVEQIRRRAGDERQATLAREFGVGASTISRIVRGTSWRHVA